MYIDVVFSPCEFQTRENINKSIAVIDVLRATSTIVYALYGYKTVHSSEITGCLKIKPVETVEEALSIKKKSKNNDIILAGERFCLRPEGFLLGNSPCDFVENIIRQKTIVFSTTNGTKALKLAQNSKFVTTASFVNATKSAELLYNSGNDVIILCAGRSGKTTIEDTSCAGFIVQLLIQKCLDDSVSYQLSDSAYIALNFFDAHKTNLKSLLKTSEAGQNLINVNLERDIDDCLEIDYIHIGTKFENGYITIF